MRAIGGGQKKGRTRETNKEDVNYRCGRRKSAGCNEAREWGKKGSMTGQR